MDSSQNRSEGGRGRGRKVTPAINKIRLATKIVRNRSGRGGGEVTPTKPMTRPSIRPVSPDITDPAGYRLDMPKVNRPPPLDLKTPSAQKELPAAEKTNTLARRTRRSCRLASQENLSSVPLSDPGSLENMKKTARGGRTKSKTINEEDLFKTPTPKCETLRKAPSILMYGNSLNPASAMCVKLKMMDQAQKDEEAYHEAVEGALENSDLDGAAVEGALENSELNGAAVEGALKSPELNRVAVEGASESPELNGAAVEGALKSPELNRAAFVRAMESLEELDRAAVERATLDLPIFLLERLMLDLRRDNNELEGEIRAQETRKETLSALVNSLEKLGSGSSTT